MTSPANLVRMCLPAPVAALADVDLAALVVDLAPADLAAPAAPVAALADMDPLLPADHCPEPREIPVLLT